MEVNQKAASALVSNFQGSSTELSSDRESSVESFHTNKSDLSNASETELIDVDDLELSDEESWLYKSPKKLPSSEKSLVTLSCLNKEVEDMNTFELQQSKDALLLKIQQLTAKNLEKEGDRQCSKGARHVEKQASVNTTSADFINTETPGNKTQSLNKDDLVSAKNKENELFDASDIHKIARLQEESLQKSTSRFLEQLEKRFQQRKLPPMQNTSLTKPASAEALNICSDKYGDTRMYSMQHLAKQNIFSSSSCINDINDSHRGSLPDIHPGYYSLRLKKSRQHSGMKSPCPLPLYPQSKLAFSGVSPVESQGQCASFNSNCCTLPSSRRSYSRRSSSSSKDIVSPHRDISPGSRNTSILNLSRRDSTPSNPPRFISPLSSPTLHQRRNMSSPVLHVKSPTLNTKRLPQTPKSRPRADYYRTPSPSRRMPLTSVYNQTPKMGNSPVSPRKETSRNIHQSSKIPSPASRSGIPVPSYRGNNDDDTWSQDCF